MTDSIYRELTANEIEQAHEQKEKRTQSEKVAYRLLPWSMRQNVERNPPVAFVGCKSAFFPDLFLRNEKVCIEIDGGYHCKRERQDAHRDKVFREHGFIVIRIKNLDTCINVAFWERLLEGLNKVEDTASHPHLAAIKEELRQMISDEISSWTRIDTNPI